MPRRTGAVAVLTSLFLFGSVFASGASGAAEKTPRTNAPTLTSKFRERLAERGKKTDAKKVAPARLRAKSNETGARRAQHFAARAGAAASAKTAGPGKGTPRVDPASRRPTLPASKTQGTPFEGRSGTGLGDVAEREPNDTSADTLEDIPVNVVGYIDDDEDIDYFAFTATGGETIRLEVIADRFFNTLIDSYLVVLAEDGETVLESNDDAFSNSRDSFISFTATASGSHVYFVGVSDFAGFGGGDDYGYVLNVTVADTDFNEVEPNDTTSFADFFPVPAMAFGFSDSSDDLDVYVFDGVANEALIVDVDAELFFSLMDPVVELYDDNGGFLFGVDDADGLDPRFNIVLPYTGEYFLVVYNREADGGDEFYYTLNLSTQSAALAPRVRGYKIVNGQFLKRVTGNGFVASNGGSYVEIEGFEVPSRPAPRKPTTVMKVAPAQSVSRGEVLTVVNPDGRRSNPGVIQ